MLQFRTATMKYLGWFCGFFFKHITSPSYAQFVDTHKPSALRISLASLPWKRMEFSEESTEAGHVWNLSKYSFLICFLMVSIYFPCGWKSAAADHPMGDVRGDVQGQGCCPCEYPVGRSPDPWPLGVGTAHGGIVRQDKHLCLARAQRGGEVRDLRCKYVREKPRGWGMWRGGLNWESPAQRVTLIISESSVWLSHWCSGN